MIFSLNFQVVDMLADAMMRENMILSNLLIFSCEEDQAYCLPFLERGLTFNCLRWLSLESFCLV